MARILIIDDDAPLNKALCRLLRSDGHMAASAHTGSIALSMIAAARPDLVILDEMMPEMTGLQVLKAIRDNPDTAALPVVFYSAVANREFCEKAQRAGANAACSKLDFEPVQLLDRVGQILAPPR